MINLTKFRGRLIVLSIVAMMLIVSSYTVITSAAPLTPSEEVQQVWHKAQIAGRYNFTTSTHQTTHPTEMLVNVGRSPKTEQFAMAGQVDRIAETLMLQFWPYGRERGQSVLLKQEGGVTYGRVLNGGDGMGMGADQILRSAQDDKSGQDDGEGWVESQEAGEIFRQGRDPLRWLTAAKNIRPAAGDTIFPGELLPESLDGKLKSYQFDINGLEYARYMKGEMEAELRRSGELPAGISLGMVQEFVDMQGRGELWVTADGLPLRQVLTITFPAQEGEREWVEATITTDFKEWNTQPVDLLSLDWSQPDQALPAALRLAGVHPQDAARTIFELGLVLLLISMAMLLFNQRLQKPVRITFSLVIIASMVAGPLLQVQQMSAFTLRMEERSGRGKETGTREESNIVSFDPQHDPLASAPAFMENLPANDIQAGSLFETAMSPPRQELIRAVKTIDCDVTQNSDCDGDGLHDHVEIFQLGTWVDQKDSDNDGISDNIEVVGFTVDNRQWYLDPRNPDSNGDGIADSLECPARANMSADGQTIDPSVTADPCPDTDGDQVPDIYDFDNDGDGVPDSVDEDPNSSIAVSGDFFGLSLAGYQADKPLLVDISIRPADDRHLWWTHNYLDWPDLDQNGQIMRVSDVTLNSAANNPPPIDGDMMLSPILEVTIPFNTNNRSRGLPLKDGVNVGSINANTPLDNWLDTDTLDLYGITAALDENGVIGLYAPLHLKRDVVGDSPVAWHSQLIYEMPGSSSWADDHQIKLCGLSTPSSINACRRKAKPGPITAMWAPLDKTRKISAIGPLIRPSCRHITTIS